MSILISTTMFPNRVQRGNGIFIFRQAAALKKLCDVKVISPVPYFPGFLKSERYSQYARVPKRDRIGRLAVVYPRFFVTPKILRFCHGWFLFASVRHVYRRIVARHKPQVLLCFWAFPDGVANAALARVLGLPLIVGCLGSDVNIMPRRALHRILISRALRRADRVFVVSRALGREVEKLGVDPGKIATIPNGVDPVLFRPRDAREARARLGIPLDGPVVVCVARLSPEKGVDLLIQAAGSIKKAGVRWYLVGEGVEEASLRRLVAEAAPHAQITFCGARPTNEIPDWMTASDVVALPSRHEGCPNVVMEALACGRPVVGARVGGVPELLSTEDLGILAAPNDPDSLAAAIDRALDRKWDPVEIASKGGSRTWDDVAGEIVEECRSLVER